MKHFVRTLALAAVVALHGCSTDFDLTSDWKDITVVYGLLNPTDTAQYVKINKAFLSESTSALELAQNVDSVFYQNLDVRLEEINDAGQLTNTFNMVRVNGNDENLTKPLGIFVNDPNWLYKTTQSLNTQRSYRIVVTKSDGNAASATTRLVSDLSAVRPFLGQQVQIIPGQNQTYIASWKNARNAVFYGLTIRFFYIEFPDGSPADSTQHAIDWVVFADHVPDNTQVGAHSEYRVNSNEFYQLLAQKIPTKPGFRRRASHMEFIYAAGGQELYSYYLVGRAQGGLTSGQIMPVYTNIENGKGIFSSRTFRSTADQFGNVPLRINTIDSIACYSLTRHLRFENSGGLLCP